MENYRIKMKQIERIQYMENLLDYIIEARKEQHANQEKSTRIQKAIRILADYYSSKEWKQNFADDEAGMGMHKDCACTSCKRFGRNDVVSFVPRRKISGTC